MTRPDEAIQRLRNDAVGHELAAQAVHYYGDDNKGHGKDITEVLDYIEQLEKKTLLADDHVGMRANGLRYLVEAQGRGFAAMRQQMAAHLKELAEKYYAGQITIVDEFLQLYSIGQKQRKAIKEKGSSHAT